MTKNKEKCIKCLVYGNFFFDGGQCCEALLQYNRGLCFAEDRSNLAATLCGKRAVVYFHLKEYELCLSNIQLAQQHQPLESFCKLDLLKAICIELMKTHRVNPDEDPVNFFKLSHPANVRLPCLSQGLRLKVNKKYGRHIVSTRDFNVGDIIAVSDFSFIFFDKRARLHHCNNCIKSSMKLNLIPCTGCSKAMYCSEECMAKDKKKFHQFECANEDNAQDQILDFNPLKIFMHILAEFDGNVDEMITFLEANNQPKCVFDFDLSNKKDPMYNKNMILATLSMTRTVKCGEKGRSYCLQTHHRFIMKHPELRKLWLSHRKESLDNLLLTFLNIEDVKGRVNSSTEIDMNLKEEGYDIIDKMTDTPAQIESFYPNIVAHVNDPYMSLLNQSCYPNLITKFTNGCHAWIVVRPVKAGDQLFVFIGPGTRYWTPREERQRLMLEWFGFECDCDGCRGNWPPPDEMKKFSEIATTDDRVTMAVQGLKIKCQILEGLSPLYVAYKEYSRKITAMSKYYPVADIVYLEAQWMFNIYRLAVPAKWFCRPKWATPTTIVNSINTIKLT